MNWTVIMVVILTILTIIIVCMFVLGVIRNRDRDYPGYELRDIPIGTIPIRASDIETPEECKNICKEAGGIGYNFYKKDLACDVYMTFQGMTDTERRYPCKMKSKDATCGVIHNKEVPDCELCSKQEYDSNVLKDHLFTEREFKVPENKCENIGEKCEGTVPKPYTGWCTVERPQRKIAYCYPSPYKLCKQGGDGYYWRNYYY